MQISAKRFGELSAAELYEILRARAAVFVVEQKCAYQDIDGRDLEAVHVVARGEDGELAGYLRVMRGEDGRAWIGRVLALRRRQGVATRLLREGLEVAGEVFGARRVCLEAQTYARGLYEKAGFVQTSEQFLEDGIPHVRMEKVILGGKGAGGA